MSAVTPEASRVPTRPKRARTRTGAVGSGEYLVPRLSRSVVLGSVHLVKNGRSHRSSCTSSFHSTPAGRPTVETSRLSCAWIAHCQPAAEPGTACPPIGSLQAARVSARRISGAPPPSLTRRAGRASCDKAGSARRPDIVPEPLLQAPRAVRARVSALVRLNWRFGVGTRERK